MIITNSVSLNTGESKSNLYFYVNYDTSTLLVDGKVYGLMNVFLSEADRDARKAQVTIVGERNFPITKIWFQVGPDTIVKEGQECTITDVATFFNAQAAAYLQTTYNWTITQ